MNYELRIKNFLRFSFLVVLVVFSTIGGPAFGWEIGSILRPVMAEGIDLSLSPPLTHIRTTAGNTLTAPITITNHSETKQKISFSFVPFLAKGDDGEITMEKEATGSAGMFTLVEENESLPGTFELRPHETAKFTLSITIPPDTKHGDYYETLLFQTENEQTPTQTSTKVQAVLTTNILLSVYAQNAALPPVQARIETFSTNRFFSTENIVFRARVENLGDYFLTAAGEIVVFDNNGRQVHASQLSQTNVLAHSMRILQEEGPPLSSKRLFGKYVALVKVRIGDHEVLTDSFTFYVVPQNKALLLTIGLIVILLVSLRLHVYRRNRRKGR